MDRYLTTLRRRRKLVRALVKDRQHAEEAARQKSLNIAAADAAERKALGYAANPQNIKRFRTDQLLARGKIRRINRIKRMFLERQASEERKSFSVWVDWLGQIREERAAREAIRHKEEQDASVEAKRLAKEREKWEAMRMAAEAPSRKGAKRPVSSITRRRERLFAAGRLHHEVSLLPRVDRVFNVSEKNHPRPLELLIRPVPEILEPPSVDRPEPATDTLVSVSQQEDPVVAAARFYLSIPLEIREGEHGKHYDVDLDDPKRWNEAKLLRRRKDGDGAGAGRYFETRERRRLQRRDDWIVSCFKEAGIYLPMTINGLLRYCRPLVYDVVNNLVYLVRRPDPGQALSNDGTRAGTPWVYSNEGNKTNHGELDCSDLLTTKLLLVPAALRPNVLWWSYQESQQFRQQQDQLEQSKREMKRLEKLERRRKRAERRERARARRERKEGKKGSWMKLAPHAKTTKSGEQEKYVEDAKAAKEAPKDGQHSLRLQKQILPPIKINLKSRKVLPHVKRFRDKQKAQQLTLLSKNKGEESFLLDEGMKEDVKGGEEVEGIADENESDISSDSSSDDDIEDDAKEDGVHHAMHVLRRLNSTAHKDEQDMVNCDIQENIEELISDVLKVVLKRYWWPAVSQDVRRYVTSHSLKDPPATEDNGSRGGAHDCHRQALLAATRNDLKELRRLVLNEGAGLFARGDVVGESAIHHAVKHHNFDMLEFIISQFGGAKHHREAQGGRTAVHFAASTGQLSMLKWMRCKKFDFTAVDSTGMGVVHHAVLSGRLDMVRWLVPLLQGAHPLIVDGPDQNGVTPRWLARGLKMTEIAEWLGSTLARWEGNMQRIRDLDPKALFSDDYAPTDMYRQQRATNLVQRWVRRWLAKRYVKKYRQDEKARRQREKDLSFMPTHMRRRNSMTTGRVEKT